MRRLHPVPGRRRSTADILRPSARPSGACARLGLDRCDSILLTHAHVDHVFGLDDVRRYNAVQRSPIELPAEPATMEVVERTLRHVSKPMRMNPSFVAQLLPGPLAPGLPVDRSARFERSDSPWSTADPGSDRGPRWRGRVAEAQPAPFPLAYCTDVSGIPPETWPRLEGLRTLVLDMLRPRAHPTHFTVDQAVETAARIGAERTWFLHMSHEIRHAELDPTLPAGMRLAWDGLRLR